VEKIGFKPGVKESKRELWMMKEEMKNAVEMTEVEKQ